MARKLDPRDERLLNPTLNQQMPSDEANEMFWDLAAKRDKELVLSPELLAFFGPETSLPFFYGEGHPHRS